MIMSICFGFWTYYNRDREMVRISQPVFLGLMCFGTFLMASSICFLGWQEPWRHLDFACMAGPWLLTIGFSTSFSALFAKTWRINRLFRSSVVMLRTHVHAKDVLMPTLFVTVTNVIILTIWTAVSPLHWVRRDDYTQVDAFGRPGESRGSCRGANDGFWIVLVTFNFVMVVFANYQSFLARNIPSDFNESLYITLSMASLLECFLIGIPLLILDFLTWNDPSADFVLKSVLIAFGCASILLPMYAHMFRSTPAGKIDLDSMFNSWGRMSTKRYSVHQSVGPEQYRGYHGGGDGGSHDFCRPSPSVGGSGGLLPVETYTHSSPKPSRQQITGLLCRQDTVAQIRANVIMKMEGSNGSNSSSNKRSRSPKNSGISSMTSSAGRTGDAMNHSGSTTSHLRLDDSLDAFETV